jgi:hypothetical protein
MRWYGVTKALSLLVQRAASEGWEGQPDRPPARRTEGGMEPDDLLCSRNARSRTPLVGRAQWKINQPPSLERQRASLEGAILQCSFYARNSSNPPLPSRLV